MGAGWKGIEASSDGRLSPQEGSYDVGLSPQEDRSGAASTMGEDTSGTEESCIKYGARIQSAASVAGFSRL